jgi:hypothetical protein
MISSHRLFVFIVVSLLYVVLAAPIAAADVTVSKTKPSLVLSATSHIVAASPFEQDPNNSHHLRSKRLDNVDSRMLQQNANAEPEKDSGFLPDGFALWLFILLIIIALCCIGGILCFCCCADMLCSVFECCG